MFKDTTGIMKMELDTSRGYIMVTKKRRETRLTERLIPLNKGVKFRLTLVDTILSVSFVRITGSKGLISMCTLNCVHLFLG